MRTQINGMGVSCQNCNNSEKESINCNQKSAFDVAGREMAHRHMFMQILCCVVCDDLQQQRGETGGPFTVPFG